MIFLPRGPSVIPTGSAINFTLRMRASCASAPDFTFLPLMLVLSYLQVGQIDSLCGLFRLVDEFQLPGRRRYTSLAARLHHHLLKFAAIPEFLNDGVPRLQTFDGVLRRLVQFVLRNLPAAFALPFDLHADGSLTHDNLLHTNLKISFHVYG